MMYMKCYTFLTSNNLSCSKKTSKQTSKESRDNSTFNGSRVSKNPPGLSEVKTCSISLESSNTLDPTTKNTDWSVDSFLSSTVILDANSFNCV